MKPIALGNVVGTIVDLFRAAYHWLVVLVYFGRKKVVPPINNAILLKPATVLAAEIREGKIKSEDVVRAYIERIEIVNPYINAVAEERFSEAIKEAKEIDDLVSSGAESPEKLEKEKPLLGVPFTIKILLSVKGLRCTAGSTIFRDLRAHEDAEAVRLMKNAGGICIATTNSPEFGVNYETVNAIYGRTNNPYDTTRTPGGSSGGEAALIGAAGSVIGIGNDLGGSVRFPSFNCCIFAHKPTAGLVSNKGTFPVVYGKLERYLAAGPMCRYAEDLVTMMKVLAREKAAELKIGHPVNFKELKIYYTTGGRTDPIAPDVEEEIVHCIKKAARHFEEKYNNKPKRISIRSIRRSFAVSIYMLMAATGRKLGHYVTGGRVSVSPLTELIKLFFRLSNYSLSTVVVMNIDKLKFFQHENSLKIEKTLKHLEDEFAAILDDKSVLLMPTFATTALLHTETMIRIPGTGHMGIFNILGHPVSQCSMGLGKNGLPIGFQVVGGRGQDNLTIAVALEIERAFGGWVPPAMAYSKARENVIKRD